jgi:putative transcriptional regulator
MDRKLFFLAGYAYFNLMISPKPGVILISDPFLKDPNFMRTVVLLCEHNAEGSFGFVLNRPFSQRLSDFIPDLEGYEVPVFYGGPVQPETLHFVHDIPELTDDAALVANGVYWGGKFERVIKKIHDRTLDLKRIRFFLGYSGWSDGQLDEEMDQKSWLTTAANHQLVFKSLPAEAWADAIHQLDSNYHEIVNYPIDPLLN